MDNKAKLILRAYLDQESRADSLVIAALKSGELPTPKFARDRLLISAGKERLLSHHIFWKERKLREGLQALMNTAGLAYVDICRHDAALTAFPNYKPDFSSHLEHVVTNPSQKDVMAFCAAAIATVDTTRRLRLTRPDITNAIALIIDDTFKDNVAKFVKDLRNNLSHGSVVVPGWVFTKDERGQSGRMAFEVEDLLSFGKWSAESRSYAMTAPDGRLNIADAVHSYFVLLNDFYKKLQTLLALNVTAGEQDYYDIVDEGRRWASRQFMKVLVGQIGHGKNPYEFLHRFFNAEEVRQIRRFPDHSREQVRYLISLRSVEIDCDKDLEQMLLKCFGVPEDTEGAR